MGNKVNGDPVFDPWIKVASGVFDRKVSGTADIGEMANEAAGITPVGAEAAPHPIYGDQSKLAGHVIEINPENPERARREAYSLVGGIGADRAFVNEMMRHIDTVIDNEPVWREEGLAMGGGGKGGTR